MVKQGRPWCLCRANSNGEFHCQAEAARRPTVHADRGPLVAEDRVQRAVGRQGRQNPTRRTLKFVQGRPLIDILRLDVVQMRGHEAAIGDWQGWVRGVRRENEAAMAKTVPGGVLAMVNRTAKG